MTIIYEQCNKATKTEIALGTTYNVDRPEGNLIESLKPVHTVCFRSDDRELSFVPYKQVAAVKSMNNYNNNKPYYPHAFKEKIKIKYNVIMVVVGKFTNRIGMMIKLLGAAVPVLD